MNIKEIFKEAATCFFHWWWDQPETNTEQGFEDWWEAHGSDVLDKLNENFWIEGEPEEEGTYLVLIEGKDGSLNVSQETYYINELGYGWWLYDYSGSPKIIAHALIPEYKGGKK